MELKNEFSLKSGKSISKASVKPTVIGLTVCPCGLTSAHQFGFLCELKLHLIKSVSLRSV